ncbi:hypothetical protein [Aliikangiella maris]|uniref:Uncharacterized protein n=2 Tax=Aliikangiella maris TaxID=3162458 RepID=A0ABV3MU39_9GAMM
MKNLLILILLFSFNVNASSVEPTKITKILVGPAYGNNVLITVSNKATDTPECQTNNNYQYAFDGSTESGKMTLSVVLAAYASKKDVWLGGYDRCDVFSGTESLKHIVAK